MTSFPELALHAARIAGFALFLGLLQLRGLGGVHRLHGILRRLVDLAVLDELRGAVVVVLGAAVAAFAFDAALIVRHGELLCVDVGIERTGTGEVTTISRSIPPAGSRPGRRDAAALDR